jgi:hypothetical protein
MIVFGEGDRRVPAMDDLLANHFLTSDTSHFDLAADLAMFDDSPASEKDIRDNWQDTPVRYGGRMFPRAALLDYYRLVAEGEFDVNAALSRAHSKFDPSLIPPYEGVKDQLAND